MANKTVNEIVSIVSRTSERDPVGFGLRYRVRLSDGRELVEVKETGVRVGDYAMHNSLKSMRLFKVNIIVLGGVDIKDTNTGESFLLERQDFMHGYRILRSEKVS